MGLGPGRNWSISQKVHTAMLSKHFELIDLLI
jgi:hypothetical protein